LREPAVPSGRSHGGRVESRTGLLIVALLFVFYAAYFAARPAYNWDMVAYVAVALIDQGEPVDRVHDETYAIVENAVPSATYADLTASSEYRRIVAGDAARFVEQLPFYSVKPVYPWLMSLLHRAGIGLVAASVALSAAAYAGICLLLYAWIARRMRPLAAVPLAALLALCPYVTPLAHLSTPDGLSVLVLLSAVFCVIEGCWSMAALALLPLAVLVRPENIVYAIILLAYATAARILRPLPTALAALAAVAAYIVTTRWSGNYGWTTLFYFTYVDQTIDLARFASPLGLDDYARIYVQQLDKEIFLASEGLPLFLLVGFGAFLLAWRRADWRRDRPLHLILLGAVFIALRTVAFPGEAHRALVAAYLMLTMALILAGADLYAAAVTPTAARRGSR
jgi:hypothetical protein